MGAPVAAPSAYGKGVSRPDALAVSARIAERGALGPPAGLGMSLAAPTIATHGTPEQIEELVRPIVTGQRAWCQLFSEPGAGSDLAGLGTRAVRDGDEWVVNGQKVWTSGGQIADMGMLVARTNPEAPKHQGITWFAFDMHQGGAVDVRPLREMTGRALFNEVFLSDARVPDSWVVGGTNNGWAVANSTLTFERQGLSAGGQGHAALALPGTVVGDLPKRAGDFVRPRGPGSGGAGAMVAGSQKLFVDLARANGTIADPSVRQQLMKLHTLNEIARYTNLRAKAERGRGRELPGVGNLGKLAMSEVVRTEPRPRPGDPRSARHAARLHARRPQGARRGDRRRRRRRSSPRWRCSPRRRRSTAAPTRSSATSSASACSGCRRSRATSARSPGPSSPATPDDLGGIAL